MAEKLCYRDVTRVCDKSCEAFLEEGVAYRDVNGDLITGHCIALSGHSALFTATARMLQYFLTNKGH